MPASEHLLVDFSRLPLPRGRATPTPGAAPRWRRRVRCSLALQLAALRRGSGESAARTRRRRATSKATASPRRGAGRECEAILFAACGGDGLVRLGVKRTMGRKHERIVMYKA